MTPEEELLIDCLRVVDSMVTRPLARGETSADRLAAVGRFLDRPAKTEAERAALKADVRRIIESWGKRKERPCWTT